jgi:hypothetical protein
MKAITKIILSALAYLIGLIVTGALAPLLHLPAFPSMPGESPEKSFIMVLFGAPLLAVSMLPLASGLGNSFPKRCLAMAALMFVTLGLNTLIELLIFGTMLQGVTQALALSLHFVLPTILAAAVLAYPFQTDQNASTVLGNFTVMGWTWRLLLAWLSFPVIYFVFGLMVAPIVVPIYNAGVPGLRIPAFDAIIRTQLIRSAIFLAASLPVIVLWKDSRNRLLVALGLALTVTVGVFGLVQAYFLPTALRVTHSLEIAADSFVYAAVLTWLFARSTKSVARTFETHAHAAD